MMQNKYFILPGIYLTIYKSNSCSKSKMHVKYVVDKTLSITGCTIENWIFLKFIQLFNVTIVTFFTSHNTSEPWQNFIKHSNESRGERGAAEARSHLVPPPTGFTLLNILRLIWWYPHLITRHNTSSVTITLTSQSPTWIRSKKSIPLLNILTQTS